MSVVLWKIALVEGFKRYGRALGVKWWNWRTKLARKREEKKHEEAIKFSNGSDSK